MIDIYLVNKIFIFLVIIIGIWVAFVVFFADKKNKINQLFSLSIVALISFNIFSQLSHNTDQVYQILLWKKLFFITIFLFLILMYLFSVYFPKIDKRYPIIDKIIIITELLFLFLTIFTDSIVKDVEIESWGTNIIFGEGKYFLFTTMILYSLLIVGQIIRKYFILNVKEKLQAQYFLIGLVIFSVANLIFNMFYPLFLNTYKYYYIGDYSAIFLLGFTAYAIAKHELMGIKPLITQILIVIISIILLVDVFLLSDDIVMQLLKFGVLIAFVYFSRGMVESVRKEKKARKKLENSYERIDQNIKDSKAMNIKLKEKNEDLKVLLNISDVIARTLDPKKIAQDIVDSVPKNLYYLKYVASFMVLYDVKTKHTYAYFITESIITKKIRKLIGKTLGKHSGEISVCLGLDNLIAKTIKKKKIQISDKLEDFIAPSVNVNICRIIQKLAKAKSYVSTPLFSSGRVVGVIVFVSVKSKKEIVQRDKDILYGFSSHIGSAIENAELYKKTNKQMEEVERLNISLKNANQKLKELLEVKNEFLHITSHQLRTPLTAIRGMISMWYDGDFDDLPEKEKRRMVKRILTSTERLNNITNDMLDSLELEGGFLRFQFKASSISSIIRETINTLKSGFEEKKIYIKIKVDPKVPDVEVEPNYIRQVFMNIIDNACKYTKEGGVDISVKKIKDNCVEIKVVDSGIGISKIDNKKVFEKFSRGKNAIEENASGSGLGMFIARKIINAHDGEIDFQSGGIGQGTTVRVLLKIKHK